MDYTLLNDSRQAEIARGRLLQAEADHFAAELDIKRIEAIRDNSDVADVPDPDAQIAAKRDRQAQLEEAAAVDRAVLKELEADAQ